MGLYDRDYTQADFQSRFQYTPRMRIGFPSATPVVKWLLIINVSVFLFSIVIPHLDSFIYRWFPFDATTLPRILQFWRLITYQFLHGGFWHIFFNMWALWMFGPILENRWGSRQFLPFYIGCGVVGALFYLFLVLIGFLPGGEMIGASGAVLGIFAACAILVPGMRLFLFPFPISIPIRTAAVAGVILYLFFVMTRSDNAGGHAAHLAGMAAGAAYVYSQSWRTRFSLKVRTIKWQKKMARQRELQLELDRILQKVHELGIHSLTAKEKRTLKKATEAERMKNRF